VLAPDESATLRERLVAELSAINSADDAATWAHRNLPVKNSLTAEDAQIVEAQFKARLSTISDGGTAEGPLNADPDKGVVSAVPRATDTLRNLPQQLVLWAKQFACAIWITGSS
jgi:hypothetical protein